METRFIGGSNTYRFLVAVSSAASRWSCQGQGTQPERPAGRRLPRFAPRPLQHARTRAHASACRCFTTRPRGLLAPTELAPTTAAQLAEL